MPHSTYPQTSSDWNFRRWLVPMLLTSLLIHVAIGVYFQLTKLQSFVPVERERLIPRKFKLEQVTIDPRLLQTPVLAETGQIPAKPIPDIAPVQITESKKSFAEIAQEIRATPISAELTKPLLNENPKVDPAKVNAALTQMEERNSMAISREMDDLRKQLISEKPSSLNQPALQAQGLSDFSSKLAEDAADGSSTLEGNAGPDGTAGFSSLDQLITQTGPLTSGTAPILMPTDLLYDYDSYILREGAVSSLSNLGKLIQKNPQATFIIEGYTDSFGSLSYNQQLSLARAEGVKTWLLSNMSIDPSRVQTRGFGSTKLLVPSSKSMEEQQLNRRVEIVIKTR